ncbi:glutamate-1-semialdehyde aminotransferase [Limnochorda pilosa]|uniref:Glutamate-1-semialdehyde 2,1-aminomutase n=1 Tax=Limnochorda pilosa TaxID=1555112 RepID=A0A0K2SP11_LIMPI|nr:glutamate-1-semialdehyde 2,1-aminomutase [Limnochorda pilosa]BAS28841.1 glutamate-1-semialdehyde aminotransferase [Limnochorda pilosa]
MSHPTRSASTAASEDLFRRALAVASGGVHSPSRSYAAVGGGAPRFMVRGEGAYLFDADGHRYIDYLSGYGAIILGHAPERVVEAVRRVAPDGLLFGTPTPLEVELDERLCQVIPSVDRVRFTASGTEAVMTAIRLARAFTGKTKLVKFDGSYHGHSDPVLVSAGSGFSTLGIADSAGIPPGVMEDVISLPYNQIEPLEEVLFRQGAQVAAVLVEPVVGNFGLVPPKPGYLEALVEQAHAAGALVIFDEVITAFRFGYGAVQDRFGLRPDITVLGKIIGGGMPIGAYGARAEIMDLVAPLGPMYQDGTWAGHPLSMAAGLACLEALREEGLYARLERLGRRLAQGLRDAAGRAGVPVQVHQMGGAIALYFTGEPVDDFAGCERSDSERFARFFRAMLQRGVHLAPSKYEVWFVTAAHTEADVEQTLEAAAEAFRSLD